MTERTCEQIVGEHMASREAWLADRYKIIDDGVPSVDPDDPTIPMDDEGAQERIDELGLGVSAYVMVRIELSTGGPADWLEVKCLTDGLGETFYPRVQSVTYHHADWFDHAERDVPEDSPLWRYAEGIVECGVEL